MLNFILEFGGDTVIYHWIVTVPSVLLFIFVTYSFRYKGILCEVYVRSRVQKFSGLTYKSRAKWKTL